MDDEFKKGDTVRLKPGVARTYDVRGRPTARVAGFYSDIEGGLFLDTYIGGFRSWNVQDLVKVSQAKPRSPTR